ncbi:MAG: hypothetical protein JO105_13220 [Hyphomicrobiales bacterium]|nr:hypothetical protein [Hyphomicrobiales bacterium]
MIQLISVSAGFLVGAGYALYCAVDAARWRDWRRFFLLAALTFPLLLGASWIFAIAVGHPTVSFWGNIGFGPDWACQNLGNGAHICSRDLPPRFQPSPGLAPPNPQVDDANRGQRAPQNP